MARLGLLATAAGFLSTLLFAHVASAQQAPPPAPPPPPPGYGQPVYVAPTNGQPGYYYYPPPSQQPQVQYQAQPQPVAVYEPREDKGTHAPKYSLWTGARLSYLGFGLSFFDNVRGEAETTGNFIGNGIAPQIDLGARISYRYIPYVFFEHGFMGQGHRFEGSNAKSSTEFYGIGFRYVSGDVDSVAFLSDLSIGKRSVTVSDGNQTYTMSGIEFFRLGLGAEIRIATLFALTPLASISTGSLYDTEGNISYACAAKNTCPGGENGPPFTNGKSIPSQSAGGYVVLSLGLGIHFDVFGK